MSDQVKAAAIIGVSIVVATIAAVSILSYFSPMQTCVRGGYARTKDPQSRNIERSCASALSQSTTVWTD